MYSIKEKRIEKGWSQEKLADKSGVSRTTLSKLETAEENGDEVITTTDTLINIANALECSVSDIFLPKASSIIDEN